MDRAAIVTGASSRIGLALARALAEDMIAVDDIVATVRWLLGLRPIVQVRDVVSERTLA